MLTPKRNRIYQNKFSTDGDYGGRGGARTVVAFSIGPVVPEVGVLLKVLPDPSSPHPGALQESNKTKMNDFQTQ